MNNCLIISVESRKGGVGKTTAALNLARVLKNKQYAVLFLDADITGTNAADFVDSSPFWNDCHPVHNATSDPSCPVNLLELFERTFMSGLGVPRFLNEERAGEGQTETDPLIIHADGINIIGSQIYNLTSSTKKGKNRKGTDKKNNGNLICRPNVLFDELHSFWFIEFLQNLCKDFLATIRQYKSDRPVAVVIDNSPGYIGIAPAVQEWLTDLGPEKGKFLILSSLDMQDILSCSRAINNLHKLYKHKWNIRRKFVTAIYQKDYSGTEVSLDTGEESFFVRLLEAHQKYKISSTSGDGNHSINGVELPFYRGHNAEAGEAYLNQLEKYQGLVINRVPRLVKQGAYAYDIESLMDRNGNNLIQRLLGEKRSDYFDWMVSYDEYIEYQFLQPMISRRFGRVLYNKRLIKEFMHIIQKRHTIPGDEEIQFNLFLRQKFNKQTFEEIRGYLRDVHMAVEGVIHFADEHGFSHLTRLIHEEWLPGNILRELSMAIMEVFMKIEKPFIESEPWGYREEPMDPEIWSYIDELYKDIKRNNVFKKNLSVPSQTIKQIFPSLIAVVLLSSNQQWWLTPIRKLFHQIIIAIITIEDLHWKQKSEKSRKGFSIQKFLAAENLEYSEWNELKLKMQIQPYWFEFEDFSRVYHACASAQARLIDVRRDAEFLVEMIQRLVMEDVHKGLVLPYIRGVAENVIIKKKMSHESGKKDISEGFRNAQYMKEFSEVLERLLKRWEIL